MRRRAPAEPFALVALVALVVTIGVLAGCAGTTAPTAIRSAQSTAGQSSDRMVMPAVTGSAASGPTATAAMVCGSEIKGEVQKVLKLQGSPKTASIFVDSLFTCNYSLPAGPMRLSVQHSSTKATALAYLEARRDKVGVKEPAAGLGEIAYATGTGVVLVLKDNETLEVDTTGLPTVFGSEGQKRTDLAYEVASVVLGCWTGDDDS